MERRVRHSISIPESQSFQLGAVLYNVLQSKVSHSYSIENECVDVDTELGDFEENSVHLKVVVGEVENLELAAVIYEVEKVSRSDLEGSGEGRKVECLKIGRDLHHLLEASLAELAVGEVELLEREFPLAGGFSERFESSSFELFAVWEEKFLQVWTLF